MDESIEIEDIYQLDLDGTLPVVKIAFRN